MCSEINGGNSRGLEHWLHHQSADINGASYRWDGSCQYRADSVDVVLWHCRSRDSADGQEGASIKNSPLHYGPSDLVVLGRIPDYLWIVFVQHLLYFLGLASHLYCRFYGVYLIFGTTVAYTVGSETIAAKIIRALTIAGIVSFVAGYVVEDYLTDWVYNDIEIGQYSFWFGEALGLTFALQVHLCWHATGHTLCA